MTEELRRLDLDGDGLVVVFDNGMTEILIFSKNVDDYNPQVSFDTQRLLDFLKGEDG